VLVAYDRDPVASGVVASLSRPGGNVTGRGFNGSRQHHLI